MRALFIVLSATDRQDWAQSIANAAGTSSVEFFVGAPAQAAQHLATHQLSPSHIVLDIGDQGLDILADVDLLAQKCEPGTRVVTVGNTNDVQLYRGLLARGVIGQGQVGQPRAAFRAAVQMRFHPDAVGGRQFPVVEGGQ